MYETVGERKGQRVILPFWITALSGSDFPDEAIGKGVYHILMLENDTIYRVVFLLLCGSKQVSSAYFIPAVCECYHTHSSVYRT